MSASSPLLTDLRLLIRDGGVDLDLGRGGLDAITGEENLGQALTMRILVARGELAPLGHPRYGSEVHEVIGRRLSEPNRQLLRRIVRKAIEADPRVARVDSVVVTPREHEPGSVDVAIEVTPISGPRLALELELDVG